MHQLGHVGWEQPSLHHLENSWQQGSSGQWQYGNFDYYQQQPYEEVSSNFQGGRIFFSTRGFHDHPTGSHNHHMGHHPPPKGYHEQLVEHAHFDTRLITIEEGYQEIRNTLYQHTLWQEEAGQCIVAMQ
jgi:hypothetical protein